MASRAVLAVALLSVFVLANAQHHKIPEAADKADEAAANPVLRLPSERSVPSEAVTVDLTGADAVHQDADASSANEIAHQDPSSAGETATLDTTTDPATAIPSSDLKVSLIPLRASIHRVHLTGPLRDRKGAMSFFWSSLRPRHHSRLFHRLFLDGRDGAQQPVEVHFGGDQDSVAMRLQGEFQLPLPEEMMQQDQQEQPVPRILAFRIRRLGPHHHGMMHNCAWMKRLEALTQSGQEEEEKRPEGTGLIKRFTVFLNPQQN